MGRRKLDEHEKVARLNARKELKQTKNSLVKEDNISVLSEIKTEVDGEIMAKLKRGRKSKAKSTDQFVNDELANNDSNIDFFSSMTKKDDINSNITVSIYPSLKPEEKIINNLPWIEKYRPNKIEDIILDDCLRNKLKNLVNINDLYDASNTNEISCLPNLIITGSPGTGKTSTMFCIAKQILGDKYGEALLELNASDNRGLEIINNSIIHFCKKKINGILDGSNDNNNIKKIIIFDEADNITRKAQNVLANMMEEYGESTRFCFTCNDSSKIIESIQSRCLILHYRPMNRDNIKKRLDMICQNEKVNYDEKGLEAIIFISQGDIRQAINNLEATYNSYNMITEENVYKLCYQPHPNTVINLIQKCASRNLIQAIEKYEELKEQGYCNSDILQTMSNVLKLINIDEHIRINFIKIISDTYLNVSEGVDTSLQMYSCISKMIAYINIFKNMQS
jgi:replication factor C subunit 2/4